MNNTLFNLAREATQWCCDNLPSDDLGWEHKWEIKYGELIVKQCLALIECEANQYNEPTWAVELVTDIQNHFEVDHENL